MSSYNDPQLMELLDFNPEDLVANQKGQLSPRQQKMLRAEDIDETRGLIFGLVILAIIGLLVLALCSVLINLRVIIETQGTLIGLSLVGVAIVVFLLLYANWQGSRERSKWPDVATLVGPLDFSVEQRGSREFHYILIDGQKLFITPELYTGLQRHRRQYSDYEYRLHYATRARRVLSAEIMKIIE